MSKGVVLKCDDSSKVLVINALRRGGGGLKMVKNCVASFMDDP